MLCVFYGSEAEALQELDAQYISNTIKEGNWFFTVKKQK